MPGDREQANAQETVLRRSGSKAPAPGLHFDIGADKYHEDPCDVPSLSSSIAGTICNYSPLHAYSQHPKLGGRAKKRTSAMDGGTLIHALLLDAGRNIVSVPFDDYRTNAAKAARDEALACGSIPVIAEKLDIARKVASNLEKRLRDDFGIVFNGKSEVVAIWHERGAFGPVVCRAMLDHVFPDAGIIFDLKTSADARPRSCSRSAVEYGYAIQHAAYTSALQTLRPELVGRVKMSLVFAELEAPYAVTPCVLSAELAELGQLQWRRAVRTWEQCLREDTWPGYTTGRAVLDCPSWAMTAELEFHEEGQELDESEPARVAPAAPEYSERDYADDSLF